MAKKILVVDGAKTVRKLAKFSIARGGYEVIEAEDGVAGLAAAIEHKPDLIITDLNMPHMGGLDMSEKIKENPDLKHIPIFALTTEASSDVAARGKQIGILAWIVKPFVPDALLAAIIKIIGPAK